MSSPARYDGAEMDATAQAAASTPLPNSPAAVTDYAFVASPGAASSASSDAAASADADAAANAAPTPRLAQPPRPLWQRRAESCVRGFERRKSKKLRRKEWGICTLAFPNEQQEKVFEWCETRATERYTHANGSGGRLLRHWTRASRLMLYCLCFASRALLRYFAQIRERNMRGSMLLLAFAYMLYATIEWKVRWGEEGKGTTGRNAQQAHFV